MGGVKEKIGDGRSGHDQRVKVECFEGEASIWFLHVWFGYTDFIIWKVLEENVGMTLLQLRQNQNQNPNLHL